MIIVFAGPPLSGKSYLSQRLSEGEGIPRFSVDEVRTDILPASDQSRRDRNIAYRAMHQQAHEHLSNAPRGASVIVDATYGPAEHRAALVSLAHDHDVGICLIECWSHPNDAAQRFRERSAGHAAIDLTEASVRDIAATFPLHGGGLSLDTSAIDRDECLARISAHVRGNRRLASPNDWSVERSTGDRALSEPGTRTSDLIAPMSQPQAGLRLLLLWVFALVVGGLALLGFVLLALKGDEEAVWIRVLFAAAGGGVTVGAAVGYFSRPWVRNARALLKAGSMPRFGPLTEVRRSNRELVSDYLERMPPHRRAEVVARMPGSERGLPEIPIVFVIEPSMGRSFDIHCDRSGSKWDEAAVRRFAAEGPFLPFDWHEYSRWRRDLSRQDYFGLNRRGTRVFRVTAVGALENGGPGGRVLKVAGSVARYEDYVITEQSARIEIDSQLPYLREFLEGPRWNARDIDLTREGLGSSLYLVMANVSVIVTTTDDLIPLQRRSSRVQAAGGGIGCSAGGNVEWRDLQSLHLNGWNTVRSLRWSVFREVREELGLSRADFVPDCEPFIAAAHNLRYGRDLNFYAHLQYKGSSLDLERRFAARSGLAQRLGRRLPLWSKQKDSWEIAHLVFLPIAEINQDGTLTPRGSALIRDDRHVRGALHALALSGRLRHRS